MSNGGKPIQLFAAVVMSMLVMSQDTYAEGLFGRIFGGGRRVQQGNCPGGVCPRPPQYNVQAQAQPGNCPGGVCPRPPQYGAQTQVQPQSQPGFTPPAGSSNSTPAQTPSVITGNQTKPAGTVVPQPNLGVKDTGFNNLYAGADGELYTSLNNSLQHLRFKRSSDGGSLQIVAGGTTLATAALELEIANYYCVTAARTVMVPDRTEFLYRFFTANRQSMRKEELENCSRKIGEAVALNPDQELKYSQANVFAKYAPRDLAQVALNEMGLKIQDDGQVVASPRVPSLRAVAGKGHLMKDVGADGKAYSYWGKGKDGRVEELVFDPKTHDVTLASGVAADSKAKTQLVEQYCAELARVVDSVQRVDFLLHQIRSKNSSLSRSKQNSCLTNLSTEIAKLSKPEQEAIAALFPQAPKDVVAIVTEPASDRSRRAADDRDELERMFEPQVVMHNGNISVLEKSDSKDRYAYTNVLSDGVITGEDFKLSDKIDPKVTTQLAGFLCMNTDLAVKNKNTVGYMLTHAPKWAKSVKNPRALDDCLSDLADSVQDLRKSDVDMYRNNKRWLGELRYVWSDDKLAKKHLAKLSDDPRVVGSDRQIASRQAKPAAPEDSHGRPAATGAHKDVVEDGLYKMLTSTPSGSTKTPDSNGQIYSR